MPVVKKYAGRRVEKMQRKADGILLIFANATKTRGQPKERKLISQSQWEEHGESVFVAENRPAAQPA